MMRNLGLGLAGAGLVAALVWALWPEPVAVDLGAVTRGPMRGEILVQGVTRVRNPYAITAPFTGTAIRSPVEVGDAVVAGETVVAVLQPADPGLLDARSRTQAEAAVVEAKAAVALAESNLNQSDTALAHAEQELQRSRALAEKGNIPRQRLEDAEAARLLAQEALSASRSQLDLSRATLARAEAQLIGPDTPLATALDSETCCVRIRAPQTGLVLSVTEPSARLVQAGAPLLTIGNLDEMEIEADLLSVDAVQVPANAPALVERWGGEGALKAQLRRIEPAAFTRVSALGIEEQRVRLRLDLLSPPADRMGLGDGFRVQVRLILWEEADLLQLPQSALFRDGEGWAVFTEAEGTARLTPVRIGREAEGQAEVLEGLAEGDRVILYPDSAIADGSKVRDRNP